jgi:hypothetical protein
VGAWLAGLWGTVRRPFSSLGVVLLWAVLDGGLWVGGLLAGHALGGSWWTCAVLQLLALLRAFVTVAMFAAFASVVGLAAKLPEAAAASARTTDGEHAG